MERIKETEFQRWCFRRRLDVWYQRIHDFLKENPDIVDEIEKETGAQNVLEFFRMQNW